MIRKFFTALALTAAVATGAAALTTQQAEAKCKFGCGLAIGLGAGIVGSAIIDSNRRDYHREGYDRPARYRRSCSVVRRDCRYDWGYRTRNYYRCIRDYGC